MPHYCLCSACGSKYNLALVGHQLTIRDLPELKTVVSSSVAEVVRTKVKQTIGMKLATDGEGDSSESKSGNEDTKFTLDCKYSACTSSEARLWWAYLLRCAVDSVLAKAL